MEAHGAILERVERGDDGEVIVCDRFRDDARALDEVFGGEPGVQVHDVVDIVGVALVDRGLDLGAYYVYVQLAEPRNGS